MSKLDFLQLALNLASEAEKDKEVKSIEYYVLKRLIIAIRFEGDKQDMARNFLDLLGDKQELAIELIDFQKGKLEELKLHIKNIKQQREINQHFAGKRNAGGTDE